MVLRIYAARLQARRRNRHACTDPRLQRAQAGFAIIGVLTLAVVLLLTNTFVWHQGTGLAGGAATANIPAKSVAVLPLVNESGDKDQQYFSDGLSEEVITALSQFAGLKVINRDSSFRFRNTSDGVRVIGDMLGVAHLLEGSVQKLGDRVRISVERVNVSDGSTVWSQHHDRPYQDLFALRDDITRSVADALQARLLDGNHGAVTQSDRPPGGSVAAWNAYQQGQFYYQRGSAPDLDRALAQFAQATHLDPGYAATYAAIAQVRVIWHEPRPRRGPVGCVTASPRRAQCRHA